MSTGKRLAKRSIIGTRVCAPGDDGKFYSGVIHAVKTAGPMDTSNIDTRYSVRFDGGKGRAIGREFKDSELIGPGFRSVVGCVLKLGQKVYLTYNGREISGEVTSHSVETDEVVVSVSPPGNEVGARREITG